MPSMTLFEKFLLVAGIAVAVVAVIQGFSTPEAGKSFSKIFGVPPAVQQQSK